jgi:hypothetical protein
MENAILLAPLAGVEISWPNSGMLPRTGRRR